MGDPRSKERNALVEPEEARQSTRKKLCTLSAITACRRQHRFPMLTRPSRAEEAYMRSLRFGLLVVCGVLVCAIGVRAARLSIFIDGDNRKAYDASRGKVGRATTPRCTSRDTRSTSPKSLPTRQRLQQLLRNRLRRAVQFVELHRWRRR
jgi:hypothetical protein